jgi:cobalt/nickel transport system permease protein
MKALLFAFLLVVCPAFGVYAGTGDSSQKWLGVDKTVIERVAKEANRPPKDPWINTDQGDLLLLVFLIAGAMGGFVGGYCFRGLFSQRKALSKE